MKKIIFLFVSVFFISQSFAQKNEVYFGIGAEGQQTGDFGMGPSYRVSYRRNICDRFQIGVAGYVTFYNHSSLGVPTFNRTIKGQSFISSLSSQSLQLDAIYTLIKVDQFKFNLKLGYRIKYYDYVLFEVDNSVLKSKNDDPSTYLFLEGDQYVDKDIMTYTIPMAVEISYDFKNNVFIRGSLQSDIDSNTTYDLGPTRVSFGGYLGVGYRF